MGCSCSKKKKEPCDTISDGMPLHISCQESGGSGLCLEQEEIVERGEERVGGLASGEGTEDRSGQIETGSGRSTKESGENAPILAVKPYRRARSVLENDKFVQFVQEGGSISDLIEMHPPPDGWNESLLEKYPVGCSKIPMDKEHVQYQGIIHVNDEDMYTKRHFLAFYDVSVHTMYPMDFIKWCREHSMHNTIADYIALYQASRFHGPGSTSLKGLARDPKALGIEMSDRFVTPYGVFRAIVFRARSLYDVRRIANAYIRRLLPSAFRSVRCYFPEEQLD